jgi:hypothetical protein
MDMSSSQYSRRRFCLALVIAMLFCCLSSIEVPEFVNLTDDTSNDFTVVVSAHTPSSVPSIDDLELNLVADRNGHDLIDSYFHEVFIHDSFRSAPAYSPGVYRHLLCIDRT